MKKTILLTLLLFFYATDIQSAEVFYCDELSGVSTPLKEKSFWWNKFKWLHNGVEKTQTVTGKNKIVIDGIKTRIESLNVPEPTELIIIQNTEDKAELLEVGSVASAIYTIDKANKKLLYVKNGLVPFKLKSIIKIEKGYQMMMTADCQ